MISSTQRRLVSKGLVLVAGAIASAACLGAPPHEAGAQSAFYLASRAELAGRPGTLIRTEPMLGAPDDAAAYRVLYRSTRPPRRADRGFRIVGHSGRAGPAGGRPIVAWAHPTTGVVPRCAPSLALFIFQQVQGLRAMVERGYVVTATDYPGLGTAGPHPYLVGISEGRAVLDSVRAARELPEARTAAGASRCGGIRRAAKPRSIPGFWRRPTRRSWTSSASRRQRRRPNLPS